jgi:hypothetical protein
VCADVTLQALVVLIVLLLLVLILPEGGSVVSYLHFRQNAFFKELLEICILYFFSI